MIKRVLTDNGSAFRSKRFAAACRRLGLQHSFTRPYRPQTNGKAERFIQSALREWAYGIPYQRSAERTAMLQRWNHHYNWHRPHQGIGGIAPMTRLNQTRNKPVDASQLGNDLGRKVCCDPIFGDNDDIARAPAFFLLF